MGAPKGNYVKAQAEHQPELPLAEAPATQPASPPPARPAKPMATPSLLDLPLYDAAADGLATVHAERAAVWAAIGREWGLPIGRQVRVTLRRHEGELVGRLLVKEPPLRVDRKVPLHLTIREADFYYCEIVACVAEDAAPGP